MSVEAQQRITAQHLQRKAFLYIRQSTMRQVIENSESTARQYALRQRAIAFGWPAEQIVVIDTDLGQSGASATDREGFKTLVSEVGMGHAGIVMGLEVSRFSACGRPFHGDRVEYLCRAYALKHRRERLRELGLLTLSEVAAKLGISTHAVKLRRLAGRLSVGARKLDDCGRHMYEDPNTQPTRDAAKGSARSKEV